jgi:hypothetical protein
MTSLFWGDSEEGREEKKGKGNHKNGGDVIEFLVGEEFQELLHLSNRHNKRQEESGTSEKENRNLVDQENFLWSVGLESLGPHRGEEWGESELHHCLLRTPYQKQEEDTG